MDKIAIISDVHGNITALNTVLADIKSRGISKIYCLGDSVTKCANPDLVIDLLRQNCNVILKGNCDDIMTTPYAKERKFWTREKIGDERTEFLKNLPVSYDFYMSGYLIRLFHASPFSLEHIYNPMFSNVNTEYSTKELINPEQLFENTEFIGKTDLDPIPDIIGYGHIHTPNIFRFKNKTVFNTGSVGIPTEMLNSSDFDETCKFSTVSSYIILEGTLDSKELSSISINLVRVPYDIEQEVKYLEESDMPNKHFIINSLRCANSKYENKNWFVGL